MMCPPQRVKTCDTPSCRSARATTRPPCIAMLGILSSDGTSGPELDVFDVRNLLPQVLGQLLLHPGFDLPHPPAAHAELVADLLQGHGLLVAHERLQAPLVDDQVLARERLPELACRPADEAMVLLVGDGVGSLLGTRQKIKERRLLALRD